jgi:hypothetical protein
MLPLAGGTRGLGYVPCDGTIATTYERRPLLPGYYCVPLEGNLQMISDTESVAGNRRVVNPEPKIATQTCLKLRKWRNEFILSFGAEGLKWIRGCGAATAFLWGRHATPCDVCINACILPLYD